MAVALGWVALALGVMGAPDSGRGGVPITYSVRFMEVEGLGWRDAAYPRMTPVTRQGAATVWTAPVEVGERLVREAARSPSSRTIQAPKVTAWSGVPAHITTRANRQLVTQVSWTGGDRPAGVKPETVGTGSSATMAGRKLDQGVLVRVVLQDTQILAVHRVALGGHRDAPADASAKKAAYHAEACAAAPACCAASAGAAACTAASAGAAACTAETTAKVAVDVPEIGSQEIAGEWLIPSDGILLVSFGPHTVADKDGKAVIRERLAIVKADEADGPIGPPPLHAAVWGSPMFNVPAPPVPVPPPAPILHSPVAAGPSPYAAAEPTVVPAPAGTAAAAAAMPPMPSRSIPQGYHTDGKAADLPPLPPEEADEDEDEASSDSAETRPSPQVKKPKHSGTPRKPKPQPSSDTAMRKAQFSISNFQSLPSVFQPAPTVGLQFLVPIKPVSLKLPFNRRLELEVYGRVVHAPEPGHGTADLATKPASSGVTTK